MEGSDNSTANGVGGGHASGGSGNSRWNPTKEQISMLENLYKQGVRTPSAEQIQQITTRLKAFGHIEGKNVFYWFQNHKARQRQKQKQESLASFNRFLHKATTPHHVFPPHFHPPSPNGFCGSYYVPQNDMGFYHQQCPKMLLPSGIKRRLSPKIDGSGGGYEQTVAYNTSSYGHDISMHYTAENINTGNCSSSSSNHQETLALFPMHPTGILQERRSSSTDQNSSNSNSTEDCSVGGGQTGFFDFFSTGQEHGSFVSE